jgi:hypothetical protein
VNQSGVCGIDAVLIRPRDLQAILLDHPAILGDRHALPDHIGSLLLVCGSGKDNPALAGLDRGQILVVDKEFDRVGRHQFAPKY